MSDIRARPTDNGTVMLLSQMAMDSTHIELPIELAENLKVQIEAALLSARTHYGMKPLIQESRHGWKRTSFLEMSKIRHWAIASSL